MATALSSVRSRKAKAFLLARDGNICGICKKEIKDKPTLDHIVALVNGGTNRRENLRLTHHLCNTTKNKLVDQPLARMKGLIP